MKNSEKLVESLAPRIEALVKSNAVVGRTVSVEGRHAIPLVELSLTLGGGGGGGTGNGGDTRPGAQGAGQGGGAAGGAKATPVAVLLIEGNQARLVPLGH